MNQMTTTTTGTSLAAIQERNAFETYSEAVNRNRIIGELLKFNKGDWLVGKNSEEIDRGTKLIAAMDTLSIGWIKWLDSKPVDVRMGKVIESYSPPRRQELGDEDKSLWERDNEGRPRDPWQLTNTLILKDPDEDQLYTFAISSKGGINAIGKLAGQFGKHMRQKPNEYPIVALQTDSYVHPDKSYGRVKVPAFEIVGWTDKSSTIAALDGEEAEAAAEQVRGDDQQNIPFNDDQPSSLAEPKNGKTAPASSNTVF